MQRPEWYTKAQKYWTSVQPTVNGMLGGFPQLDPIDVKGSLEFVASFIQSEAAPRLATRAACDCGAGIGRVTKHFLLQVPFDTVDLVEQEAAFCQQAKTEYLADEIAQGRVGDVNCKGLQEFDPETGKYDLIWCQWVLGHLTDDDLVAFFQRCIKGLADGGMIGVKENISTKGYVVDDEDSSVTRPNQALQQIFAKAGLHVVKEQTQDGFPHGLFPVRMYMLKPATA
ncbi:alpha-N-methyltransferase NTM1 [Gongronella butleri]|nr:alpha-N-methyltransferase NTM1 [Gongronella butleri]